MKEKRDPILPEPGVGKVPEFRTPRELPGKAETASQDKFDQAQKEILNRYGQMFEKLSKV